MNIKAKKQRLCILILCLCMITTTLFALPWNNLRISYIPNDINLSLPDHKNEMLISGGFNPKGATLTLSYSPLKHLDIQYNLKHISRKYDYNDFEIQDRFWIQNILTGYVIHFFKGTLSNTYFRSASFVGGIYGGLEYGHMLSFSKEIDEQASNTFLKPHLQQQLALRSEQLEIGLILNEGWLFTGNYMINEVSENFQNNNFVFEKGIYIAAGDEDLKIFAMLLISDDEYISNINNIPGTIAVGVRYRFSSK